MAQPGQYWYQYWYQYLSASALDTPGKHTGRSLYILSGHHRMYKYERRRVRMDEYIRRSARSRGLELLLAVAVMVR